MSFRPGQRVQLLDEALEGRVESVSADRITVVTQDGFPMVLKPSQLVALPEEDALDVVVPGGTVKELDNKPGPIRKKGKKARKGPVLEVDLHIEKLVDKPGTLEPFEALDLQLDTARGQLEFAMRKRLQHVVFIHGVGEGVLKAELHTLLRRYDGIRFSDADYREYGQGATQVWITQEALR